MQTLQINFTSKRGTRSGSITDRVKSFEDACNEIGIDASSMFPGGENTDGDIKSIQAYAKLIIIARALNEGWTPDWSNHNQYKYVPWFKEKSGFGLAYGGYDIWRTSTHVGSRLCFKTSDLAEYAGKQFANEYRDFLSL